MKTFFKFLTAATVFLSLASCSCFSHKKDCCHGEKKECCKDSKGCKDGSCDMSAKPAATETPAGAAAPAEATPAPVKKKKK